jgi:hypothetical protein
MRSMILIAAALTGLMLVPRAAHAFQTEGVNPDPNSAPGFSDLDKAPAALVGLQGLGQTDPTHFSDSDGTPDQPGTLKLLGGTLQLSGNVNQPTGNGGVNIPGALPYSDFIPFSSPYIRPIR